MGNFSIIIIRVGTGESSGRILTVFSSLSAARSVLTFLQLALREQDIGCAIGQSFANAQDDKNEEGCSWDDQMRRTAHGMTERGGLLRDGRERKSSIVPVEDEKLTPIR